MSIFVCVCVCVCVCVHVRVHVHVCVHSCVLILCTILPDVTYFSPDVTYFLMEVLSGGRFLAGKFDVALLTGGCLFPHMLLSKQLKSVLQDVAPNRTLIWILL